MVISYIYSIFLHNVTRKQNQKQTTIHEIIFNFSKSWFPPHLMVNDSFPEFHHIRHNLDFRTLIWHLQSQFEVNLLHYLESNSENGIQNYSENCATAMFVCNTNGSMHKTTQNLIKLTLFHLHLLYFQLLVPVTSFQNA